MRTLAGYLTHCLERKIESLYSSQGNVIQSYGHEFEQTPGENEGQGSVVYCSPWGHRVRYNLETQEEGEEEQQSLPISLILLQMDTITLARSVRDITYHVR